MSSSILNFYVLYAISYFAGELQRKIGLKTIEVGGNAVIGLVLILLEGRREGSREGLIAVLCYCGALT